MYKISYPTALKLGERGLKNEWSNWVTIETNEKENILKLLAATYIKNIVYHVYDGENELDRDDFINWEDFKELLYGGTFGINTEDRHRIAQEILESYKMKA